MATQSNTSPVSDLMEGLGINPEATTNDVVDNDTNENDLSDFDTATNDDAEMSKASTDTDTPTGDTETGDEIGELKAMYEKVMAELETANKRISDKDKYINELRQAKQNEQAQEQEVQEEEDSFFDDPEGKFKEVLNQLRIANLRIDEQAYASSRKDYWDIVNAEAIQDGFKNNPTFMEEFNTSNKPYEVAYEFLSKQNKQKADSEKALRESIRQEILKEMGADKPKKDVPPSINNVGKSLSGVSEAAVDGFSAVFG